MLARNIIKLNIMAIKDIKNSISIPAIPIKITLQDQENYHPQKAITNERNNEVYYFLPIHDKVRINKHNNYLPVIKLKMFK
jgi:hypothetical protein